MNFETLQRSLAEELHNIKALDAAGRAIMDALRFHRRMPFYFNSFSFGIASVAGEHDYPLPIGFLGLRGRMTVAPDGDERRFSMRPVTHDQLERLREVGLGEIGSLGETATGIPRYYYIGDTLFRVHPIPDRDGMLFEGRFTLDLGTPSYKWDSGSSAWLLLDPDGSEIDPEFTNDWFTEAPLLIRARAAQILYTSDFQNPDRATAALQRWLEELNQVRAESNRRRASGARRGYF